MEEVSQIQVPLLTLGVVVEIQETSSYPLPVGETGKGSHHLGKGFAAFFRIRFWLPWLFFSNQISSNFTSRRIISDLFLIKMDYWFLVLFLLNFCDT